MRILFEIHYERLTIIIELHDVVFMYLNKHDRKRRLKFAKEYKNWTMKDWARMLFFDEMIIKLFMKRYTRDYVLIVLTMTDDLKEWNWCFGACSEKGEWNQGFFLTWKREKRWTRSSIEIKFYWDHFSNFGKSLLKILKCQLLWRTMHLKSIFSFERHSIWWR